MNDHHNSDPLDDASEIETAEREYSIAAIRARKQEIRTGHCRWCNDVTEGNKLYCSPDCQHDAEFEDRIKSFKGLR